jgi:hypothetical protein
VSRGEGELFTVPKPRAVSLFSVCLTVNPVGEPDAGNRHVRFDERGRETECWPSAPKPPRPSSTLPKRRLRDVRMSASPPLSGYKQTRGERAENDANDVVDDARSRHRMCQKGDR